MLTYIGQQYLTGTAHAFAYDANGDIWSGANYVNPIDANVAAYRIDTAIKGDGRHYANLPDGCIDFELRLQGTLLSNSKKMSEGQTLSYITDKVSLIGASAARGVDGFALFGGALLASTDCRFQKAIQFPGFALTGWTAISFTIKERSVDSDADSLLITKVSNPASVGTDGIIVYRKTPIDSDNALRLAASITVNAVSPDALMTVLLKAKAMNIPASIDAQPFAYEIDYWFAEDKIQIAKGDFKVSQSVLRSTASL